MEEGFTVVAPKWFDSLLFNFKFAIQISWELARTSVTSLAARAAGVAVECSRIGRDGRALKKYTICYDLWMLLVFDRSLFLNGGKIGRTKISFNDGFLSAFCHPPLLTTAEGIIQVREIQIDSGERPSPRIALLQRRREPTFACLRCTIHRNLHSRMVLFLACSTLPNQEGKCPIDLCYRPAATRVMKTLTSLFLTRLMLMHLAWAN